MVILLQINVILSLKMYEVVRTIIILINEKCKYKTTVIRNYNRYEYDFVEK